MFKAALKDLYRQVQDKPDLPSQIQHLGLYDEVVQNAAPRHRLEVVFGEDLIRDAHTSESLFDGTTFQASKAYRIMQDHCNNLRSRIISRSWQSCSHDVQVAEGLSWWPIKNSKLPVAYPRSMKIAFVSRDRDGAEILTVSSQ